LDLQHDGVVLMVESFCSRVSPTRSRERERLEDSSWPAVRVGVRGRLRPCPSLYRRLAGHVDHSSKP
jgi:hypothetical protein